MYKVEVKAYCKKIIAMLRSQNRKINDLICKEITMSTVESSSYQATPETPATATPVLGSITAALSSISTTVNTNAKEFFANISTSSPVLYIKSLGEHEYVQAVASYLPHAIGGASGFLAAQSAVDLVNNYKQNASDGENKKINTRGLLKFGASSAFAALAYTQTEQKSDVLSTIFAGIAAGSFIKAVQKNPESPKFTLKVDLEKKAQ